MLEGFFYTQRQYMGGHHGIINSYGLQYSVDGISYRDVFPSYRMDTRKVYNRAYSRTFPETEGRYWRINATGRFGVVAFTSEIELWAESFFKGGIDELRIYNRHLTPEEIMELYKCDVTDTTKYKTEYRIKYKKVVTKETRYVWQKKTKYETRYRTEYVTKYITKYAK